MKSMKQMQAEMFAKARFDGGYPRIVVYPMGVVRLVNNESDWNAAMRECRNMAIVMFSAYSLLLVAVIGYFLWQTYGSNS